MNIKKWLFLALVLLAIRPLVGADEARLLRFPAIHQQQIVFGYAGDLYTVDATGGVARKLTSHDGYEMFPRFSPDGRQLAFTAQYDGNTEIYLMPAEGGVPKRLTYTATLGRDDVSDRMGPNNITMGWTPDGKRIVFRSRLKEWNSFKGQLFLVDPAGDIPEQLPLPRGGFCSYSSDGKQLAYNRIFREFRTWKRYRGGMSDDIWIYDFASHKTENITSNPAGDIIPMWHQNRIYFISDRDDSKRFNLFVIDLTNRQTRQLTHFQEFDVKFPSLGDRAIVFENGGYIYRFDLDSEQCQKVPIFIRDDQLNGRGGIIKVGQSVSNYEIAPDGKRALFGARGDIFTVPAKDGAARNLTATAGIHERNSKWSPDGRWIAYIADTSGEDEIYLLSQDGRAPARQLTQGSDTYKYQMLWSPDSKKLLWADKKLRLRTVDVESGLVREIDQAKVFEFSDYAWSPDSRWIAYARPEEGMTKIWLFSLDKSTRHEVTDGWYDSSQPTFSPDGKYLFFVSARDFNPVFSRTEYDAAYLDMSRIYLVTLAKATASPFAPKSDEVEPRPAAAAAPTEKKETAKSRPAPAPMTVDLEGIQQRIVVLPIAASRYNSLAAIENGIYYIRRGSGDQRSQLQFYDLGQAKETGLGDCSGFEISADLKKMLIGCDGGYAIIDLPKAKPEIKETLNLSGLEIKLNRQEEWSQIYNECWRQMRDFFYAPNMHGLDWRAVGDKYRVLLPHVNHRADLTYIIGEMIAELSAGHTYVGGGDLPQPARLQTGLMGAELKRDAASGYYRIEKILSGQNWSPALRSPLTEMGVNVNAGDFILAVDGKSTKAMVNIYESLVNTVGRQVRLQVNGRPAPEGSREVTVIPIADESPLYYLNWVERNIRLVDEASGGRVGYLHIPDMSSAGLNEFVKYFYPQLRKKALIVDVRGNGGGSVSPLVAERLRRDIALVNMARNTIASPNPGGLHLGPKVCLLDEFSASDGDIFPYRFKKYQLGKLIGKRSWGGVVGIRGSLPLLDGGYLNKPEFASYGADGQGWVIEGHGVEPDIEVDNDPAKEFAGEDQQLNRAIAEILEELKTKGRELPPIPPYPDKR